MDTMDKIDFLKSMKSSCKDPEKIELIDAIIYDVEKPLAAFCKRSEERRVGKECRL